MFSNSKWSPTRSLGKERKHFTLILYILSCFNVLKLLFWQLNERNNNPITSWDVLFFKSKMKVHDTDFTGVQRKFVSKWLIWNLKLLVKTPAEEGSSSSCPRSAISEEKYLSVIAEHHLYQISEGSLQDGALHTQAQGRVCSFKRPRKQWLSVRMGAI